MCRHTTRNTSYLNKDVTYSTSIPQPVSSCMLWRAFRYTLILRQGRDQFHLNSRCFRVKLKWTQTLIVASPSSIFCCWFGRLIFSWTCYNMFFYAVQYWTWPRSWCCMPVGSSLVWFHSVVSLYLFLFSLRVPSLCCVVVCRNIVNQWRYYICIMNVKYILQCNHCNLVRWTVKRKIIVGTLYLGLFYIHGEDRSWMIHVRVVKALWLTI